MSIQSQARAAFAAHKAAVPERVVTISQGISTPGTPSTQTAQAVRDTSRATSGLTQFGEDGGDTSTLWVSLADFTEPSRGSTITVAGEQVTVVEARADSCGAILAIVYRKQKPHEAPGI